MADNTKTLNTRIALKIDTLEAWNSSTLPLLKGEVAIATTAATAGTGLTEPVVMIKIGEDGVKTFKDLEYNFYAKASDVLGVCKSVDSLTAFVNNVIASADMTSNDKFTALSDRVGVVEGQITTLNGDASTAGSVAKSIKDAIDALDLENTYAAKEHTHTKDEITDFEHTHAISEVTGLQTALDAKVETSAYEAQVSTINSDIAKAQSAAEGDQSTADEAKSAAEAAQSDVDALETLVGTLPEDTTATTVVGYVDAKTANIASDEKVNGIDGRLSTVENDYLKEADKTELSNAIGTAKSEVIGADTDASSADTIHGAKKYTDEKVADLVNSAPEDLNTLKELADAMTENADAIEALREVASSKVATTDFTPVQTKVAGIEEGAEVNIIETVKVNGVALTPDASRAVNVAVPTGALASKDKVAETDLETALATKINGKADTTTVDGIATRVTNLEAVDADARLDALEEDTHTHDNKALLDTYTQTEADLSDAVAKKHDHANKSVLDNIKETDITNWNGKANQTDLTAATDRITAVETNAIFDGDTVIINCGTSAV